MTKMTQASKLGQPRHDELVALTRQLAAKHAGKTRSGACASAATVKSTTEVLCACLARIWHLGFHLSDPRKLNSSHVEALVESWIREGYSNVTMKNALSRLRQMGHWIGKPNLVSPVAENMARQRRRANP